VRDMVNGEPERRPSSERDATSTRRRRHRFLLIQHQQTSVHRRPRRRRRHQLSWHRSARASPRDAAADRSLTVASPAELSTRCRSRSSSASGLLRRRRPRSRRRRGTPLPLPLVPLTTRCPPQHCIRKENIRTCQTVDEKWPGPWTRVNCGQRRWNGSSWNARR